MGYFRFRRTLQIIPGLRLNLSRSWPSLSLGPRGFHYTIGVKGTRTTLGLPGSGLSWTQYRSYASRPRSGSSGNRANQTDANAPAEEHAITSTDPNATIFESAPIEQLIANSTSEIAETLNTARRRWFYTKVILTTSAIILGAGILELAKTAGSIYLPIVVLAIAVVCGSILVISLIIRRRLTTTLDYDLSDVEIRQFNKLSDAFNKLARSKRLWRIPLVKWQPDWKRNAGASSTVDRKSFALSVGNPPLIKSNLLFLCLPLGSKRLYFCPDSVLITAVHSVAALRYGDLQIDYRTTRFIEAERVPSDSQVVGHSWLYVNRDGTPDRRFRNNRQLPICLYAEMDFHSSSGLNERIHCSQLDIAKDFVAFASGMGSENTASVSSVAQAPHVSSELIAQPGEEDEDLAAAFARESERARDLALGHEKHWEVLLVEELLKSKLRGLEKECDQFEKTLTSIPKRRFDGPTFTSWLSDETNELTLVIAKIKKCITEDLTASIGKAGVSGDAIKILRTVDALFSYCRAFLDFELNLCAVDVPLRLSVFKTAFRGITRTAVGVVEDLTDQWSRNVENIRRGSQKFDINVTFPTPQFQKALAEIDKIGKLPDSEPPASPLITAFDAVHAFCREVWEALGPGVPRRVAVLGTFGLTIFAAYKFFGGTGVLVVLVLCFLYGLKESSGQ